MMFFFILNNHQVRPLHGVLIMHDMYVWMKNNPGWAFHSVNVVYYKQEQAFHGLLLLYNHTGQVLHGVLVVYNHPGWALQYIPMVYDNP